MNRKILSLFLAFMLLISMLTGCSTKTQDNNANTSGNDKVKDSLVYAIQGDIATLDPLHAASNIDLEICANLYSKLLTPKYEPDLAESWTMSDDGMYYIFNLRKGVKFHNGEEFKASDVVFTIDSAKKSPYVEIWAEPIKDVEEIDEYTVKINLNYPYSPFLLSLSQIHMENEKAVMEAGESYGQNPIGTGPYKFVKHETGQSVQLTRYDDYYKGPTSIKDVTYKVITDQNTTLIALQSGEVDISKNIPAISIQTIRQDANLSVHENDAISLFYIVLNTAAEPFNNIKVRQAVAHAVNKSSVAQVATEGMAKIADSVINEMTFGFSSNVKAYPFDVEKAKALLAEAGYPNGFELTIKTIDGSFKKCAEVVQENLSKIGITAKIELGELNAFFQDTMSGNYQMAISGITITQDLDSWQMVFESTGGMNESKYNNSKVDELFQQGRELTDPEQRLEKYEEMLTILNAEVPIIPLFFPTITYVANKDLNLGEFDVSDGYRIEDMSWTK